MVYQRILKAREFRPVSWVSCFCKETGSTYRINGKHTSTVFSGHEDLADLYAVVEHYEADTLEDVARLYGTFDSRTQVRNASEINRSFAGAMPELAPLNGRLLNAVVTGIAFEKWQQSYSAQQTAAERAEALFDHAPFALWVHGLLGVSRQHYHLNRSAVVAGMLATWKKARPESTVFWEAVRDETGAKPNLPDRALARFLRTMSVGFGAGARQPRSKRATGREFFVKSLHAWNAWRRGEMLAELKYFPAAGIPECQ